MVALVVHRWVILIYATTVQKQRLVPIKQTK
jgi:hypothetical protein